MTKCKPPIFGDSAVLKKGLWVTLVIALMLALYGALFTPTWQTRAFTIDAAAQAHLHPLTDGETFSLPLPDGGIREISLPVTALSSESGGTATLILTRQGLPVFTQTALLTDSTIHENLTFSFEPVDADKLVLTFSGNTLPALGMSGGNQLCIRLSGTRPSCAMLYYGGSRRFWCCSASGKACSPHAVPPPDGRTICCACKPTSAATASSSNSLSAAILIQSIGRVSSASSGVSSIRC